MEELNRVSAYYTDIALTKLAGASIYEVGPM